MTSEEKEMQVKEELVHTVGEFTCPACGEHHIIYCKQKKHNPTMRTRTKHWVK